MIAVYWVLIVGGNPVIYIWDAIETPEVDVNYSGLQAISQTAKPGLTLLILMAKSEQEEIAAPFIEFWKKIFDLNGLDGWSVEIEWRPFEETSDEMMYRNAEIAAKIGAWTEDEIREIAGWPPRPENEREE